MHFATEDTERTEGGGDSARETSERNPLVFSVFSVPLVAKVIAFFFMSCSFVCFADIPNLCAIPQSHENQQLDSGDDE